MPNIAVERTGGSHALATAAHRSRSATCTVSKDAQAGSMSELGAVLLHACRRKELASE